MDKDARITTPRHSPEAGHSSSLFTGLQSHFGKAFAASRDAVGTLQTSLASSSLIPSNHPVAKLSETTSGRSSLEKNLIFDASSSNAFVPVTLESVHTQSTINGLQSDPPSAHNSFDMAGNTLRLNPIDNSPIRSLFGSYSSNTDITASLSTKLPMDLLTGDENLPFGTQSPAIPYSLASSLTASPERMKTTTAPPNSAGGFSTIPLDLPLLSQPAQPSLSTTTISTTVSETGLGLTPEEIQEKLDRLKKFESRFTDLAKAYKALKSKQQQLETIIINHTSVKSFTKPDDFVNLETYLKDAFLNQDAGSEVTKLIEKLQQLKQSHNDESRTHADMYGSMQARLVEREEEINRLKHKLHKLEGSNAPSEGASTPFSDHTGTSTPSHQNGPSSLHTTSMDSLSLKLKIRELTTSLQKTTEQRNKALQHIKNIEKDATPTTAVRLSFDDRMGSNHALDTLASTGSMENIAFTAPTSPNGNSAEMSLNIRIHELESQNQEWQAKYEKANNAQLAIQSLVAALREDNDRSIDRVSELEETQTTLERTVKELRSQYKSLNDEFTGLAEESENLRSQVKELSKSGGSQKSTEQVRQENRERSAGLEARLRTVQQKLSKAESKCLSLEEELEQRNAELKMLEQETLDLRQTDTLASTKSEASQEIEHLTKKLALLQQKLDSLQSEKILIFKKHHTIVEALKVDIFSVKTDHIKAKSHIQETMVQIHNIVHQFKSQIASAKSETVQVSDKVLALESEKNTLQEQLALLRKETERLADELAAKSTLSSSLESQIVNHHSEKEELLHSHSDTLAVLRSQITDLNLSIQKKETDIENLNETILKQSIQLEQSSQHNETLKNGAATLLEEQLDNADTLINTSAQKAQFLETDLRDLTGQFTEVQQMINDACSNTTNQQGNMMAKLTEMKASMEPIKSHVEQLVHDLHASNQAYKSLSELIDSERCQHNLHIENLITQIKDLNKLELGAAEDADKVVVDTARLVDLEAQLREACATKELIASRHETPESKRPESELAECGTDKHGITLDFQTQTAQMEVLEKCILDMTKGHEAMQQQCQKVTKLANAFSSRINDLQTETTSDEATKAQLQRLADGFKAKARDTLVQNKNLQKQLDQINIELTSAHGNADQLKSEYHTVKQQLQETSDSNTSLQKQLQKAQAELSTLDTAKTIAKSCLEALKPDSNTENDTLESVFTNLKTEVDQIRTDKHSLTLKVAKLELAKQELNEQQLHLANLQQEHTEAKINIAELESKLLTASDAKQRHETHLDKDLAAATDTAAHLQKSIDSLQNQIAEKDSSIQNLTEQLSLINQRFVESEKKASQLESIEAKLAESLTNIIHKNTQLEAIQEQLAQCRKSLKEEEEKKSKSIQLLRNSKTRILKLESDLKAEAEKVQAALQKVTDAHSQREQELQEKETQKSALSRQIEDLEARLRQQHEQLGEVDSVHQVLADERSNFERQMSRLKLAESHAKDETSKADERVRAVRAEMDALRDSYSQLEQDLQAWTMQSQDYETNIENLNAELETSRRLFQTKSIENDQMKIRISELETNLFDSSQMSLKTREDYQQMQRDAKDAQREVSERTKEIRRLEQSIVEIKSNFSAAIEAADQRTLTFHEKLKEYESIKSLLEEAMRRESDITSELNQSNLKLAECRGELEALEAAQKQLTADREVELAAWKMKEVQFKNLNKSLKDEVRKLSRNSLVTNSSSNDSSPRLSAVDTDTLSGRRPSLTLSSGQLSPPANSSMPLYNSSMSKSSLLGPLRSQLTAQSSSTSINHISDQPTISSPHSSALSSLMQQPQQASHTSFQQHRTSRDSVDLPDPNPEYLKHVILKFLESKDKRGQLLSVIGMLLKFTPDELKRAQRIS
ncbi:hypothetical protein BDV3_004990 [Batrachochytrium dendrobatidis]|uniref:GRIP domain-containing protein n=1 Tax=Batrachochytrium dendrobatidis (strain JEL423) TaxID=403673 RepID=A0A177WM90_BATDL|nr:hypothetical protein BDEG_24227 [Batrachochytrium dendrobatidis JEL423]